MGSQSSWQRWIRFTAFIQRSRKVRDVTPRRSTQPTTMAVGVPFARSLGSLLTTRCSTVRFRLFWRSVHCHSVWAFHRLPCFHRSFAVLYILAGILKGTAVVVCVDSIRLMLSFRSATHRLITQPHVFFKQTTTWNVCTIRKR